MSYQAQRRAAVMQVRWNLLYSHIGAVTVASGHAEYALQRLAHVLGGGSRWNSIDTTVPVDWSQASDDLRKKISTEPDDPLRCKIAEVLDWAQEKRLWIARNNLVHASWSVPPNGGVSGARMFRDHTAATVLASFEDMAALANNLNELTQRLNGLLDELTSGPHPFVDWVWPDDLTD